MKAWYLDSPEEICTRHLLEDIGLDVVSLPQEKLSQYIGERGWEKVTEGSVDLPTFSRTSGLPPALESESVVRKGSSSVYIKSGSLYVDVRDTADEWVRILLVAGELLTLRPELYHRFSLSQQGRAQYVLLSSLSSSAYVRERRREEEEREKVKPPKSKETRQLITELCAHFYTLGWVSGTGGSISICHGNRVFMAPSGVQKELMKKEEIFVTDRKGELVFAPKVAGGKVFPSLSQCAPLFLSAYDLRDAGACIHTHDISCVMITEIYQNEFRCTHQEMIKGIAGHGYKDTLVVPIIENTAHERDLAASLQEAIKAYPKSNAVLVRRHGVYVWGKDWIAAKTQAECYHYLFDWAYRMHQLGRNPNLPPAGSSLSSPLSQKRTLSYEGERESANGSHPNKKTRRENGAQGEREGKGVGKERRVKAIVTDIEGTTTPISFVKDILFPFAKKNVKEFLKKNWGSKMVQENVAALREQAVQDLQAKVQGAVAIPGPEAPADTVIDACVQSVLWQMSVDRKATALKQLQGDIWADGYRQGTLKGEVYEDVPEALARWTEKGIKVYIYSSGSRDAQRLLFSWSTAGDLRKFLSGYFDTTVGHKREEKSYREILRSLGVDRGEDVLFLTDIIQEAEVASAAGLQAVLLVRPGNAELPSKHPFQTVHSFAELNISPL